MRAGWLGIVLVAVTTFGCTRIIEVDGGDGGTEPERQASSGTGSGADGAGKDGNADVAGRAENGGESSGRTGGENGEAGSESGGGAGGDQSGTGGPVAGSGGYGATGGTAAEDGSGGAAGEVCADQRVAVVRSPANVMLVVDRSSTMILHPLGNMNRWDALYNALMASPDGLVFSMQSSTRFGFASYTNYPANGTPCPDLAMVFPPMFDNYDAISAKYQPSSVATIPVSAVLMPVGETPTGESLELVLDQLLPWVAANSGPDAEPPGPVVLLLAIDGEPDSCADISQDTDARNDEGRQMVVDQVVRAFRAGVQTYVLSVGADVTDQHLQAVANAGMGARPGTNAPFWKANDPQGLGDALAAIIGDVLSCTVELDGSITNQQQACQTGTVNLNNVQLVCGDPNGWLVVDATHIELLGTACDRFKLIPTAALDATFPCDVITVN
jgi:hypothetical protein